MKKIMLSNVVSSFQISKLIEQASKYLLVPKTLYFAD